MSFFRLCLCFGYFRRIHFLPVHMVKREDRLKPTMTARDILKKLSGCKKSLDRVKIRGGEQPV
jgi:cell division protein YceG involved in septum cleavage